jgi:hypothetical protein
MCHHPHHACRWVAAQHDGVESLSVVHVYCSNAKPVEVWNSWMRMTRAKDNRVCYLLFRETIWFNTNQPCHIHPFTSPTTGSEILNRKTVSPLISKKKP